MKNFNYITSLSGTHLGMPEHQYNRNVVNKSSSENQSDVGSRGIINMSLSISRTHYVILSTHEQSSIRNLEANSLTTIELNATDDHTQYAIRISGDSQNIIKTAVEVDKILENYKNYFAMHKDIFEELVQGDGAFGLENIKTVELKTKTTINVHFRRDLMYNYFYVSGETDEDIINAHNVLQRGMDYFFPNRNSDHYQECVLAIPLFLINEIVGNKGINILFVNNFCKVYCLIPESSSINDIKLIIRGHSKNIQEAKKVFENIVLQQASYRREPTNICNSLQDSQHVFSDFNNTTNDSQQPYQLSQENLNNNTNFLPANPIGINQLQVPTNTNVGIMQTDPRYTFPSSSVFENERQMTVSTSNLLCGAPQQFVFDNNSFVLPNMNQLINIDQETSLNHPQSYLLNREILLPNNSSRFDKTNFSELLTSHDLGQHQFETLPEERENNMVFVSTDQNAPLNLNETLRVPPFSNYSIVQADNPIEIPKNSYLINSNQKSFLNRRQSYASDSKISSTNSSRSDLSKILGLSSLPDYPTKDDYFNCNDTTANGQRQTELSENKYEAFSHYFNDTSNSKNLEASTNSDLKSVPIDSSNNTEVIISTHQDTSSNLMQINLFEKQVWGNNSSKLNECVKSEDNSFQNFLLKYQANNQTSGANDQTSPAKFTEFQNNKTFISKRCAANFLNLENQIQTIFKDQIFNRLNLEGTAEQPINQISNASEVVEKLLHQQSNSDNFTLQSIHQVEKKSSAFVENTKILNVLQSIFSVAQTNQRNVAGDGASNSVVKDSNSELSTTNQKLFGETFLEKAKGYNKSIQVTAKKYSNFATTYAKNTDNKYKAKDVYNLTPAVTEQQKNNQWQQSIVNEVDNLSQPKKISRWLDNYFSTGEVNLSWLHKLRSNNFESTKQDELTTGTNKILSEVVNKQNFTSQKIILKQTGKENLRQKVKEEPRQNVKEEPRKQVKKESRTGKRKKVHNKKKNKK